MTGTFWNDLVDKDRYRATEYGRALDRASTVGELKKAAQAMKEETGLRQVVNMDGTLGAMRSTMTKEMRERIRVAANRCVGEVGDQLVLFRVDVG